MSVSARGVRESIRNAAATDSNVLITGETGTGKELVADLIHRNSARASRPMVCINCAAIPDSLLESELFGYERGAFTGAVTATPGKLEQAAGGTIFFDEIGDLPPGLQGKLLRVLQSGGSDIRCIAATQKDLSALVEQGLFRQDLFFRLDVLRVPVPALRDRAGDIPILVEHFLGKSRERLPQSVLAGFEAEALDFLAGCDWPGNVRQLENLVERLAVTASTPLARLDDVKQALGPAPGTDPIPRLVQNPITLEALTERYIAGVLKSVGGSKTKAAEILGVDASTLYRREKRSS
jgi:two-component system response regulator HydG